MRLVTVCLLLASCASTEIFENGQRVFRTQADAAEVTFTTPRSSLRVTGLSHSNATLAGGESAATVISASSALLSTVGTAVVAGVIGAAHPTTAAIAVAAPSTVSVAKPSRLTVVQPTPTPTPAFRARPEPRDR